MAIIYSYPKVTTPLATDVLVLTDTTLKAGKRKNNTKSLALSDLASFVISSTSAITGSGTINTIPMFTPTGVKIGDSIITQAASGQGVTVTGQLDVTQDFNATGNAILGTAEVTGSTQLNGTLTVEGVTTFNADVECNNNVTVQGVFAADGNSVFSGSVTIDEQLIDGTGSSGTAGQVLSSTGTGVEWISDGGGSVTGTGTTNTLPIWTDGPNGDIGDSQLRQLGPNGSGLYQLRLENADRFIINKPSSVISGDPAFQVAQDGDPKVEFGWDDDGGGYGFLYNYAGLGWRFGAIGNNPELEITTTAGSEGVTITNNLTINGSTTTAGDLSVESGLVDGDSNYGTAGQVLSTTGTGVEWINSPDANTTYNLSGAVSGATNFAIALSGSDGTLDKVLLKAGTNITLTDDGSNGVTIDAGGSVTSVGITETGNALTITGSPVTSAGNINIAGAGTASQVILGDLTLTDLPVGTVKGTGTANFVSKWLDSDTIQDSIIFDNGTNVGIGLTNPLVPLDVAGKIRSTDDNSSDYLEMFVDSLGGGDSYIKTSNFDLYLVPETGKLLIQGDTFGAGANGSVEVYDANNVAVKVKLDSSGDSYLNGGNVGIGTTSPATKLHVSGGKIRVDDTERIEFGAGGVAINNDAAGRMYYNAPLGYYWQAGSGYKMVLLNSGNVGIGTTSPASKLEVDGGDIEVDDSASGLILRSPDGTRYRVTVANGGTLSVAAV